jgi:hypothetical protein
MCGQQEQLALPAAACEVEAAGVHGYVMISSSKALSCKPLAVSTAVQCDTQCVLPCRHSRHMSMH